MTSILTAAVVAGLLRGLAMIASRGQQDDNEEPPPITKEALLGEWEGQSGDMTITARFEEKWSEVRVEEGPGVAVSLLSDYSIDTKAGVVQVGELGDGRLLEGGKLRLTLKDAVLALPKGASVALSHAKKQEQK
jgi:hypothetical protein